MHPVVLQTRDAHRQSRASSIKTTSSSRGYKARTVYALAQPPERPRSLINNGPKRPMLQLQEVIGVTRQQPAFEVLSVAACAAQSSFGNVLRRAGNLRASDLVLQQADDYSATATQRLGSHMVKKPPPIIGVVRAAENQTPVCAGIVLSDGTEWAIKKLPNQNYEATMLRIDDDDPALLQPVSSFRTRHDRRNPQELRISLLQDGRSRHPFVAHLSKTALELFDVYILPSLTSAEISRASSADGYSAVSPALAEDRRCDREQTLTEQQRLLLTVFASYIAHSEGWLRDSIASRNSSPGLSSTDGVCKTPVQISRNLSNRSILKSPLGRSPRLGGTPRSTSNQSLTSFTPEQRQKIQGLMASFEQGPSRSPSGLNLNNVADATLLEASESRGHSHSQDQKLSCVDGTDVFKSAHSARRMTDGGATLSAASSAARSSLSAPVVHNGRNQHDGANDAASAKTTATSATRKRQRAKVTLGRVKMLLRKLLAGRRPRTASL